MIIISTAIETHELKPHQFLNLRRTGVNHSNYRFIFALWLVVNKEQIREDLDIVKYQNSIVVIRILGRIIGLKLHLVDELDAIVPMISTVCAECKDSILHVTNIIFKPARICVFKNFVDKIDTWLRSRMDFFVEIFLDQRSKPSLIFDSFEIYHFFLSFRWQPRINGRNWQIITFCELTPK